MRQVDEFSLMMFLHECMLCPSIMSKCPKRTKALFLPFRGSDIENKEEQEEKAMDTKGLRKLDYNAPLLSTMRMMRMMFSRMLLTCSHYPSQ
ncbi:hypothetical protein ACSBR1_007751 [Camellia fascicularis]